MKFIRFGGLSPLKQKHFETGDDKGFHNPPVKRGFYAFPYLYVDKFLLSATNHPSHISNKSSWLKDNDGNKIKESVFYEKDKNGELIWDKNGSFVIKPKWLKFLKRKKIKSSNVYAAHKHKGVYYMTILNKPHIFNHIGLIWHHLSTKNEYIIRSSGSWVLTEESVYINSLKKDKHDTLKELHKMDKKSIGQNDPYLGPRLTYAKDHLEVFIERIK